MAEAALVLPQLAGPARLVRAVSTVVLQVGECAVKVHPPGTDPLHLTRVHAVLSDSPVALTAVAVPVVTSHGVVTVTPWTAPAPPLSWGAVGEALRSLHDLPTAGALPSWTPLRRLPAQLLDLPEAQARTLLDRRSALLDRLADLEPVLPPGALHGDVAPDNVLTTPYGPRWIDLDFACLGMREYDVAAVVRRYAAGSCPTPTTGRSSTRTRWTCGAGPAWRCSTGCVRCPAPGSGWTDRCAGRPSPWLAAALSEVPAAR